MPLLDHFHPPLHGPRHWEGFLCAWSTMIARQLNDGLLPADGFAEPHIAYPEVYECRVRQRREALRFCAAVVLVSPANKESPLTRRSFAERCAGYMRSGVGLAIVDTVTTERVNLHAEVLACLKPKGSYPWSTTEPLYAASHEVIADPLKPIYGLWFEPLALGAALPDIILCLSVNRFVTVRLPLEESYVATCQSLRISA